MMLLLQEKFEDQHGTDIRQISEQQDELAQLRVYKEELEKYIRELEQSNDDLERAKRLVIIAFCNVRSPELTNLVRQTETPHLYIAANLFILLHLIMLFAANFKFCMLHTRHCKFSTCMSSAICCITQCKWHFLL